MQTNLSLDTVAFLKRFAADMRDDVNYAYSRPFSALEPARAHPALQRVASKLEALQAFLNALHVEEKDHK